MVDRFVLLGGTCRQGSDCYNGEPVGGNGRPRGGGPLFTFSKVGEAYPWPDFVDIDFSSLKPEVEPIHANRIISKVYVLARSSHVHDG